MEPPDEVLIRETLAEDLGSFDELMRRYDHLVFRIAYSFCGGRENALDITQTVFWLSEEASDSLA